MNENYNTLSDIEFRDRYGKRCYLMRDISESLSPILCKHQFHLKVIL